MKHKIKKRIVTVCMLFLTAITASIAQDVTSVDAMSEEISDNLDLEAIASIFGDSKDLEDFELKLNDPEVQISNLDLNEDGNVDYLRVVEIAENDTHLIAVQAVLGEDIYQDVATIEVEKDNKGTTRVQVVGDVYLYGPGYIVEPVYVHRPVIFSIFWAPFYRPYHSIYYWGYYPRHFNFWRPFKVHHYKKQVQVHINVKHSYKRTHARHSTKAVYLHSKTRKNDFGKKYPNKSYSARVARVNKPNGTKKGAMAVNQADGDKYRKVGVNKPNGTEKRAVGVNKADGTQKRAASVKKADGTQKRAVSVKKADGSRKTVAVKKNPNGSRKVVSVNKSSDGSRKVKTNRKKPSSKGKAMKKKNKGKKKKPLKRKKKS